jgi:hypothetical protein
MPAHGTHVWQSAAVAKLRDQEAEDHNSNPGRRLLRLQQSKPTLVGIVIDLVDRSVFLVRFSLTAAPLAGRVRAKADITSTTG